MRKIPGFVWLIVIVLAFATDSLACSCIQEELTDASPRTAKAKKEKRRNYFTNEFKGALFIGQVLNVELVPNDVRFPNQKDKKLTVKVISYWLKEPARTMTIYTGLNDGDCGVQFEVGVKYVFKPSFYSGTYKSILCDYKNLSNGPDGIDAKELIDLFGKPKRMSGSLSRVSLNSLNYRGPIVRM